MTIRFCARADYGHLGSLHTFSFYFCIINYVCMVSAYMISAEFPGHMFSISVAPRYGYINTDRMASISENVPYEFLDVISKKICLLNLSPICFGDQTPTNVESPPPTNPTSHLLFKPTAHLPAVCRAKLPLHATHPTHCSTYWLYIKY